MSNHWAKTPVKNTVATDDTPLYQRCHCCNSLLRSPTLNHEPVPFIMLHGTWLRDMGMEPGSRLIVEAGLGLITVAWVGPRERVEAVTPNGPDGVIHQIQFTDVHADPIQQMPAR